MFHICPISPKPNQGEFIRVLAQTQALDPPVRNFQDSLETFSLWMGIAIALGGVVVSGAISIVSWTTAVNNFKKNQEIQELTLKGKIQDLERERLELKNKLEQEIEEISFSVGNLNIRIAEIEFWLTRTNSGFIPANVRGGNSPRRRSQQEEFDSGPKSGSLRNQFD